MIPTNLFGALAGGSGITLVIGWVIIMLLKQREERTKRHGIDTEAETKRIELSNALTVQVLEKAQTQVKSMSDEMAQMRKEMSEQREAHAKAQMASEDRITKHIEQFEKTLKSVQGQLNQAISHIRALMDLPKLTPAEQAVVTEKAQAFLNSVS